MATLASKKFATLIGDFAAATQGVSTKLVDFTIGSVLRAIAEASSGVALWLQGLAFQILTATRLSTSVGTDVDTWTADFMPDAPGSDTPRLPSNVALGTLTFSRGTATGTAVVPVGAQAGTSDNAQIYEVYADQSNVNYSFALNGYQIANGVPSIDVPVRALVAGSGGNVMAGTVTSLRTGISGIDSVTNALGFFQGQDAETDAQLKARVPLYFSSLSRATVPAIGYAIETVQQGLQYTINENVNFQGQPDIGYLTIVVDDGSGIPAASLITACQVAVDQYRAASVRFGLFPPVLINVTVGFAIETAPGFDHNTVVAIAAAAVAAYIDDVGLGRTLHWSKLEQIIYNSSAGITNVTGLQLNGLPYDIVPTLAQTVKTASVIAS